MKIQETLVILSRSRSITYRNGLLVDFRNSANARRSVLLCWEEILKEMPESS